MKYGLILSLLFAMPCLGQTKATGEAKTTGPCSPAVTGSSNQFTINCQGISAKQGEEFLKILNKIAKNELDPDTVMAKLDEIAKAVQKISTPLPKRRISPGDRTEIIALLSHKTGTAGVSAIANNPEAYQFAQDWYDVLKAAGWKMQDATVRVFMSVGMPFSGVILKIHGQPAGTGSVSIPRDSLEGRVAMSLEKVNGSLAVEPYPDMPDGTVLLEIGPRPEQ